MEVTELFLVLRSLWVRIERQILVLRNVEVANSLGEELQFLQMQILGVLQSRLQELTTKIDKLANASLLRRCVDPESAAGGCHGDLDVETKLIPSQQKGHVRSVHERLVERLDRRPRDLVQALGSLMVPDRTSGGPGH